MVSSGAFWESNEGRDTVFMQETAGGRGTLIRGLLRLTGFDERALKIDAMRMSAIYTICLSILEREGGYLGLDPFFSELSAYRRAALLDEAYDLVWGQARTEGRFKATVDEIDGSELRKAVLIAYEKIRLLPDPAGSVCLGPCPQSVGSLIEKIGGAGEPWSDMDRRTAAWEGLALVEKESSPSGQVGDEGSRCLTEEEHRLRKELFAELVSIICREWIDDICELAQRLRVQSDQLKVQRNLLDADDLLLFTYRLFSEHPDVARRYGDIFNPAMLDGPEGTVSLQAAGTEVHPDQGRRAGERGGRGEAELGKGLRSHKDILTAVETIFSQPAVFGERCPHLVTMRPGQLTLKVEEGFPRVQILRTIGGGRPMDAARIAQADLIAQRLSELRDIQHHRAGEMALLLGAMSNADVYTRALEGYGFQCAVIGGSRFHGSSEAAVMLDLLRAVDDPYDEGAFIRTLISPLFDISDTGLLHLRRMKESLSNQGLVGYHEALEALSGDSEIPVGAIGRWRRIRAEAAARRFSHMVEVAFEGSAWERRLLAAGADGRRHGDNIMRFIDLVAKAEGHPGVTLSTLVSELSWAAEGTEDRFGEVPDGGSGDTITVMGVSDAKGVEFPVVAVADMQDLDQGKSILGVVARTEEGKIHLGILPPSGTFPRRPSAALAGWRDIVEPSLSACQGTSGRVDETSCSAHLRSLWAAERTAERLERHRLLYSACTLAQEVLILAVSSSPSDFRHSDSGYTGILADAFFGDDGFPSKPHAVLPLEGPGRENGPLGSYDGYLLENAVKRSWRLGSEAGEQPSLAASWASLPVDTDKGGDRKGKGSSPA